MNQMFERVSRSSSKVMVNGNHNETNEEPKDDGSEGIASLFFSSIDRHREHCSVHRWISQSKTGEMSNVILPHRFFSLFDEFPCLFQSR